MVRMALGNWRKWRPIYVLIVLSMVSLTNYYDRNLISILVEPIKRDLHVSDSQIGLLTGLAFAVVYTLVGVPVARIADRFGRATVLGVALTLWSAMTVATGFTTNFATMMLARLGVGVGEAGGLPNAHALVAEHFSPKHRGAALSTIAFFSAAGVSAALIGGGLISDWFGWRAAFMLGGGAGLVIALLLFLTVRDPHHEIGHPDTATIVRSADQPRFAQALTILWSRKAYVHLCLGLAWGEFGVYAEMAWKPAFLMRAYHLTPGQVGASFGGLTAVATLGAILLGGVFSDALSRRDARSPFWMLALAFAFGLPGGLISYLTHSYGVVLAMLVPLTILQALWVGPAYALVQNLSGRKLRATGAAIFMLVVNLIGLGVGPSVVGIASDLFRPHFGDDSLRYSLCIALFSFIPATLHFLWAARSVKADIAAAEAD